MVRFLVLQMVLRHHQKWSLRIESGISPEHYQASAQYLPKEKKHKTPQDLQIWTLTDLSNYSAPFIPEVSTVTDLKAMFQARSNAGAGS